VKAPQQNHKTRSPQLRLKVYNTTISHDSFPKTKTSSSHADPFFQGFYANPKKPNRDTRARLYSGKNESASYLFSFFFPRMKRFQSESS